MGLAGKLVSLSAKENILLSAARSRLIVALAAPASWLCRNMLADAVRSNIDCLIKTKRLPKARNRIFDGVGVLSFAL